MTKAAPAPAVAPKEEKSAQTLPEKIENQKQIAISDDADDETLFGGAGPTGVENVKPDDLIIPRLTIIQGLSPQVTQGKPEFDPRARTGMIWDVGLQEGFPDGIEFLPVYYVKNWLEWAPRSSGKGLVAIHSDDTPMSQARKNELGQFVLPSGNFIAETAQLFGYNMTANHRRSFIPMAATQLSKAKRLLTLHNGEKLNRADGSEYTPKLWYRVYKLTTVPEGNTKGNWSGWKIERGMKLTEVPGWKEIYKDIPIFFESVRKGALRGDLAEEAGNAAKDDEIPF